MPKKFFFPALAFLIFACGEEKKQEEKILDPFKLDSTLKVQSDPVKHASHISDTEYYDISNTVLPQDFADTVLHIFSDVNSKDCFTVFIPKGKIIDTKCTLQIVTAEGKLIHEHIFNTAELVGDYGLSQVHNEKEMMDYLMQNIKDLLDGVAFANLDPLDESIKDLVTQAGSNQEAYELAKKENRPSYNYTLGTEDHFCLVYFPDLGQAVDIVDCC